MLAVHKHVGNNSGDDAGSVKNIAALRLAARPEKLRHAKSRAETKLGRKCKRHVARDEQIVSGVALQLHRISGANHKSADIAAYGEFRLRTRNLDGGHGTADRAAAI